MTLKDNKPAGKGGDYLSLISEIMTENQNFLLSNEKCKETCSEIVELCNDAIDYIFYFAKRENSVSEAVRFAIVSFTFHVLMPQSNAIYPNLLLGNVVACFNELRLMTESLAMCYWADLRFPEQDFFHEKLGLLGKEGKSISKYVRDLDEEAITLWAQLSQEWVHTKSIMDRLVTEVVEKSGVPVWALATPMSYTSGDVDVVHELGRRIVQFRLLLKRTIDRWRTTMLQESV